MFSAGEKLLKIGFVWHKKSADAVICARCFWHPTLWWFTARMCQHLTRAPSDPFSSSSESNRTLGGFNVWPMPILTTSRWTFCRWILLFKKPLFRENREGFREVLMMKLLCLNLMKKLKGWAMSMFWSILRCKYFSGWRSFAEQWLSRVAHG